MSSTKPTKVALPIHAAALLLAEWARIHRVPLGRTNSSPAATYQVSETLDRTLRLTTNPNAFKAAELRERRHHVAHQRGEATRKLRQLGEKIAKGWGDDSTEPDLAATVEATEALDAELQELDAKLAALESESLEFPLDLAGIVIEVRI